MSQRFSDSKNDQYIFRNFDFDKNLPLDDIPMFIKNIWFAIKNNKDINLPSEKIMVSEHRCSEIKHEAL